MNDKSKPPEYTPKAGDGFITRVQPSRRDKKDELRKIILAHSDINAAYDTAIHFLNVVLMGSRYQSGSKMGMDNPLYQPLLSAIVVSYAKPFIDNDTVGKLRKRWSQFDNPRWAAAHERILKARHELFAHSDADIRQIRIHPAGQLSILRGQKTSGIGYSIRGYNITYNEVKIIADLSLDLATRLHKEVDRLLHDLFDGMELPNREFFLRSNHGL